MRGTFRPGTGFNPRTRAGCDLDLAANVCAAHQFQSTHPRGVRRPDIQAALDRLKGFNPRTRAGCDRSLMSLIPTSSMSFNPRTRAGCDPRPPGPREHSSTSFNPRTRAGCDRAAAHYPLGLGAFQSTHPRGVRLPIPDQQIQAYACFNPRTRAGCDRGRPCNQDRCERFNPRTRAGCDIASPNHSAALPTVSIHAPARGATCVLRIVLVTPSRVSIHAPARGATVVCLDAPSGGDKFQSTHPRGVRPEA